MTKRFVVSNTKPATIVAMAVILLSAPPAQIAPVMAAPAAAAKKPAAAQSLMAQGFAAYQAKRYAESSALLWQSIQKEGPSAWSYLYLAHSELAQGHNKLAAPYYKYVTTNYRDSAEAKVAAQYLARLDPSAAGAAGAAGGSPRSTTPGAPESTAGGDGPPKGMSSNLLDRIEIVRPVMGHPEVSSDTIATIRGDLEKLPKGVKKILIKGGIKFCITTSLVDKYPEMGYQEGRGYDGHSLKRCPGMFNTDTVVICERVVDEASNEVEAPIRASSLTQTFYHEIGHALDSCLDDYSLKNDYRHAYYLDIARIPPDVAGRLAYYMQKSIAGQQESCGEITAVCLGSGDRHGEEIRTYFPLTIAFIKKKLNIDQMLKEDEGK